MITNEDQAREFIQKAPWVFAKSYANTFPHEYTTRDRVGDNELFESFIKWVREQGTIKSFYKKQYIYYELDGYEYWEMGRPVKATIVLNKAKIDDNKTYRKPPPRAGAKTKLQQKLLQRDERTEELLNKEHKTQIEQKELQWLMNSQRKSPNRIDHSEL